MPSRRKLEMRRKRAAKKLARDQEQRKGGHTSRYAIKRARMAAGWDNPRSPLRVSP